MITPRPILITRLKRIERFYMNRLFNIHGPRPMTPPYWAVVGRPGEQAIDLWLDRALRAAQLIQVLEKQALAQGYMLAR